MHVGAFKSFADAALESGNSRKNYPGSLLHCATAEAESLLGNFTRSGKNLVRTDELKELGA